MKKNALGFTLMEIMIVVAIVGILASLAYPAYQNQVREGRRSDAMSLLTTAAAAQERHYFQNTKYGDDTGDINDLTTSPQGYYTLTIDNNDGVGGCTAAKLNCFTLTATPTAGTDQVNDTACATLKLDHLGERTATGSDSDNCW